MGGQRNKSSGTVKKHSGKVSGNRQFSRNQTHGRLQSDREFKIAVIQSEVSQKEKKKYRMLTHIYGI